MDFKKPIPEGEAYYMDDDGNVITESDFIAEFIKKCDYKYTPDERLDKLMNNIPDVIAKFDTFTQDEVFRSKVKDSDGSLNSILDRTAPENRYGFIFINLLLVMIEISIKKSFLHFYLIV